MKIKNTFHSHIFGYIGSILVLLALALISVKLISGDGFAFYLLNGFGGFIIALHCYVRGVYSSVFLNIFFVLFSLIGVLRLFYF